MLAGFPLEASIKGLLVVDDPTLVMDDKLDKQLVTHAIGRLIDNTGIVLNEAEDVDLVQRLEMFSSWAGRSPTPTTWAWPEHPPLINRRASDALMVVRALAVG
jgi:hypothetical protein